MKLPHRFAVWLAINTFVLLVIGGIVHGTGSSLACPDWPLCYGEVFPKMVGGVEFEHTHRLVAAEVAILTFVLAGLLMAREHRAQWAGIGAQWLVIGQAILGGITVIYKLPVLVSSAHLAVSMLFLSLLVYIAYRTRAENVDGPTEALSPSVNGWVAVATAAVYVQIVLGGLVRHTGAGLACLDVPFCQGDPFALAAHPSAKLQMLHRWMGVVAGTLAIVAAVRVFLAARTRWLRAIALAVPVMVLVQVTLGVLSVTSLLGLWQVTAHLGGGAVLLTMLWVTFLATRPALTEPRVMPRVMDVGEPAR